MVVWYHLMLCHPGMTRLEQTIRQHFWWKTLRDDVQKQCYICQRTKIIFNKYGTLTENVAEAKPWENPCVDMVGPYTIKIHGAEAPTLWCVTMIDTVTGWFEMKDVKNK
jgi:Integrase zinc binding domain